VERIVRQVALEYLEESKTQQRRFDCAGVVASHARVREGHGHLFGPGSELTFDRAAFQEGNFAAKETVTIVGPRSS